MEDKTVWSEYGFYGSTFELKIVSTERLEGTDPEEQRDVLEGNYWNPESVAGPRGYKLVCHANVVENPSRIDDNTSERD